ncbi:MAG: hypothetical protein RLP14_02545 [Owenweeksia sp.]
MNFVRRSPFGIGISMILNLCLIISILNPVALRGVPVPTGPGQPELESFSALSSEGMVDSFTGDFSYNLPLLNVPGPDGGYPLHLNYKAGSTMDQEASWVGLGWNLNAGVVNREVRGLPDDFSGQAVIKTMQQKPNRTFSVNIASKDIEALGLDLSLISESGLKLGGSINFTYNTYKGFSVKPAVGFSLVEAEANASADEANETENIDEDTGENKQKESMSDKTKENEEKEEKKGSPGSFGTQFKDYLSNVKPDLSLAGGLGFAGSSTVQDIPFEHPRNSFAFGLNVKAGITTATVTKDIQVDVFYSDQKVEDKPLSIPAFGYLYSEMNYQSPVPGMMDLTRGNEAKLTPDSRLLPVPSFDHDIFYVKAQGVSGSVRAYKGGVAVLSQPRSKSSSSNFGAGVELNFGVSEFKGGVNPRAALSESYSGPWTSADGSVSFLKNAFQSAQMTDNPLLEPFYFKFENELNVNTDNAELYAKREAARLQMETIFEDFNDHPKLTNSLHYKGFSSSLSTTNSFRNEREPRTKNFFTLTEREASFSSPTRQVFNLSNSSWENVNYETNASDPGSRRIGEIRILNEAGKRFIYGIPAKNTYQKQVTFSKNGTNATNSGDTPNPTHKNTHFTQNNVKDNDQGTDNFVSTTETPEYAHSFLLTEILSEDYADVSGDGPSSDDMGNYVLFKYNKQGGYKTRGPIQGASYLPGNLSNSGDDKGSFTYFEKDIYYLKSVETKTHIAVFQMNVTTREDAYSLADFFNADAGTTFNLEQKSRYLKKITLYSRAEYEANPSTAEPIQAVNFEYDYSLCDGVPSNKFGGGKLTLKEVWFSKGSERTKRSLSPFSFTYGFNPDYNTEYIDRWASYQSTSSNAFGSNVLHPYTNQYNDSTDVFSEAWNLIRINTPTGGQIDIEYEADQYQYVQDQRAQNMYRVKGFGSSGSSGYSHNLADGNSWMYVEFEESMTQNGLDSIMNGVDDAFYKIFMKYKDFPSSSNTEPSSSFVANQGGEAYDYLKGYVRVKPNTAVLYNASGGTSAMAAFQIDYQGQSDHPVKKAGWVDLTLNHQDLVDDTGIDLSSFRNLGTGLLGEIGNIINTLLDLADDDVFFVKSRNEGYCDRMSANASHPASLVRLNSPGNKYGGGHRVKSITVNDKWGSMGGAGDATYGQNYFYTFEDGSSSGVAAYEPLTGGEENPFRKPVRYSSDRLFFRDQSLYTELPLGESYFPAPSVGYSRVKVINKANDMVTLSAGGVQVSEYYTAKDYPTKVEVSDLQKVNIGSSDDFRRFLGLKSFFEPGFSQGYYIELNDMHGKQKSVATYKAGADLKRDAAIQKQEFYYKTKGGYSPSRKNELNNRVLTAYSDSYMEPAIMGESVDIFMDLHESYTRSTSFDIAGNLSVVWIIPLPSALPKIDYTYNMTRKAVLNRVVSKTAILEKVIAYNQGAKTEQQNIAFDSETGSPVVSSMTNEHEHKIFSYKHLGHWYYPGMGGSYQNIGATLKGGASNYTKLLQEGDVLLNSVGNLAWVTGKNNLIVVNSANDTISNVEDYKIIRSGFRNNLTANAGGFESLFDQQDSLPLSLSFLKAYNQIKPFEGAHNYYFSFYDTLQFKDCEFGDVELEMRLFDASLENPTGNDHLEGIENYFSEDEFYIFRFLVNGYKPNPVCANNDVIRIIFPKNEITQDSVNYFNLVYAGGGEVLGILNNKVVRGITSGENTGAFKEDIIGCFGQCLGGILNASVTTFIPENVKLSTELPSGITPGDITTNPYRYGFAGVYKPHTSDFYLEKRLQTNASGGWFRTNIVQDGEFDQFSKFHREGGNNVWNTSNTNTLFDYNGNLLETQNAIGNYSSTLYGYERTLPIAMAGNARYKHISAEGFEDHNGSYDNSKSNTHLAFTTGTVALSAEGDAHTGNYSAKVSSGPAQAYLSLDSGSVYTLRAWHKTTSAGSMNILNGQTTNAEILSPDIEGWELLEIEFTSAGTDTLQLQGTNAQFDDIRVQPFRSSMVTYVYDPLTQKLVAQLDENNFATIYNYDRDQVLVQVKKETERGIKTIQATQRVTVQ